MADLIQSNFSLLTRYNRPISPDQHVNRRQAQSDAWVQGVSITFRTIKTNEHI